MNIIKKQLFFLIIAVLPLGSAAQVKPLPAERADSVMQDTAKPLFILITTDWCKYCQMQKKQLLKNKDFQSNAGRFYYIELNAETREDISFNGQAYPYRPAGASNGIHELAVALNGSERVSFPTWVLLDKNYQPLFKYDGVLSSSQLNEVLKAMDDIEE